ncbi:hypothetical protein EJB05_49764 [Eragrostis curvula]|uniref:Enhancer of polycomb-like protein n=1 Tax=Eragrostis curvula TaxID=38414 RepID=A0A5J9T560_9POAL|nr:hypothetical protein EJB05_49764 [Eragrostis curvula]
MTRPSFRPRPVDINRRLPIVRSTREFVDDDPTFALRPAPPLLRHSVPEPAADGEAYPASSKKKAQEIPTPQYDVVGTYERNYTCTFAQPATYIRGRGARNEIGEFVEYDLDNEDEDWLEDYNNERKNIVPEILEVLLFKLEILDHKARERAGIITPTLVGPIPVILDLISAMEALQYLAIHYAVFQAVYNYWKAKRERWQKPILRHLQILKFIWPYVPPPPASDTNPYNVFRQREKAYRHHTRRMQRRENSVQSFERLRMVRRNLEQAKTLMEALIMREEKKRETMECEVHLRRVQMKYKNEALLNDGITLSGLQQDSSQFGSSEDDYADSDDTTMEQPYVLPIAFRNGFTDNNLSVISSVRLNHERELKRKLQKASRFFRKVPAMQDPEEPVMLFTRPLDPDKMEISGIRPPPDPPIGSSATALPFRCQGRIGRGGRIIFDRWNPLLQGPIGQQASHFLRS